MGFGTKVLEYRKRSNMRQDEVANRVGLHVMHFVKIEKEKNGPPNVGTVLAMIGVLNLSSDEAVSFLQDAKYLPELQNISSFEDVKQLVEQLAILEAIACAMDMLQLPLKEIKQKLLGNHAEKV